MILQRTIALLSFVFALVSLGCGSGAGNPNRPDVFPVTGTVSYKQQPVEGATVLFSPVGEGYGATGITNSEGRFQLRTFEPGDGAVAGQYIVTISKYDMSTANPDLEDDLASEMEDDDSDEIFAPTSLLPARYSDAETSDLKKEVSGSSENNYSFELVD